MCIYIYTYTLCIYVLLSVHILFQILQTPLSSFLHPQKQKDRYNLHASINDNKKKGEMTNSVACRKETWNSHPQTNKWIDSTTEELSPR